MRSAPEYHSPDAWVLQQRGIAHEEAYVEHLNASGLSITNLRNVAGDAEACLETMTAMQSGVDVIVQAAFANENWFGRADVLRKVLNAGKLGNGSYDLYVGN